MWILLDFQVKQIIILLISPEFLVDLSSCKINSQFCCVIWSVWLCSTTGALEAAYHQAFGKGISLSEQQLVDCAGAFNNFGCNGGLPSQAFEYIKSNGGLDTEEAYPYTGKDGTCKYSSENIGVQVLDSVNITMVKYLLQILVLSPSLKLYIRLSVMRNQTTTGCWRWTEACRWTGKTSKHSFPSYTLVPALRWRSLLW